MTTTQKWIEAAKVLTIKPTILVLCPACGKNNLSIRDARSDETPDVLERTLYCSSCGASNSLRLVRPISKRKGPSLGASSKGWLI